MSFPLGDLGPCVVTWDPDGDDVEFVHTLGGVKFKDTLSGSEVKEDQHGDTPVDHITKGRIIELTVPFTRESWENLEKIFPGSEAILTGLQVGQSVGGSVFADSKAVLVKRIVDNVVSIDEDEWLRIYRAYPFPDFEWTWAPDGQRVMNVVFKCYPDDTTGTYKQVNKFYHCGTIA